MGFQKKWYQDRPTINLQTLKSQLESRMGEVASNRGVWFSSMTCRTLWNWLCNLMTPFHLAIVLMVREKADGKHCWHAEACLISVL